MIKSKNVTLVLLDDLDWECSFEGEVFKGQPGQVVEWLEKMMNETMDGLPLELELDIKDEAGEE